MNLNGLTTEELESRDLNLTKQIIALKSWNNRSLSAKNRQRLVDGIREEQNAITAELIKREAVIA
jgi:hypothetical protein